MSPFEVLIQSLISGILMGGVYVLASVGLTLGAGILNVVNFAYGEFLMLGMYVCFWLVVLWQANLALVFVAAGMILFLVGMVIYRLLLEPLAGRGRMSQNVVTFGCAFVLQSIAQLLWSARYRSLNYVIGPAIVVGPFSMPPERILAFAVALSLCAMIYIFLQRTFIGKAIRSTAQNRLAAELMGVNVKRIFMSCFGLAALCAGVTGALLALYYPIYPAAGVNVMFLTFVIMTLGGRGSYGGAIIAGLLMGVYESLFSYYVSPAWRVVAIFALFLCVLWFLPRGLKGERKEP